MWLETLLEDLSKKYDRDLPLVKKDFNREMAIVNKLYPYAQQNKRFMLSLSILERKYYK